LLSVGNGERTERKTYQELDELKKFGAGLLNK